MNKKEISEIKKQFTPDRCCITRICGCYVDGEKNKKTELKEAFLSLSEEEKMEAMHQFIASRQSQVPQEVLNYLLSHSARNLNFLLNTLQQLEYYALQKHRRITVPLLKQYFKECSLG